MIDTRLKFILSVKSILFPLLIDHSAHHVIKKQVNADGEGKRQHKLDKNEGACKDHRGIAEEERQRRRHAINHPVKGSALDGLDEGGHVLFGKFFVGKIRQKISLMRAVVSQIPEDGQHAKNARRKMGKSA